MKVLINKFGLFLLFFNFMIFSEQEEKKADKKVKIIKKAKKVIVFKNNENQIILETMLKELFLYNKEVKISLLKLKNEYLTNYKSLTRDLLSVEYFRNLKGDDSDDRSFKNETTARLRIPFSVIFDFLIINKKNSSKFYEIYDKNIEKVSSKYFKLLFILQLKKEFLEVLKSYTIARRHDLKEFESKLRIGAVTKSDFADFSLKLEHLEIIHDGFIKEINLIESNINSCLSMKKPEVEVTLVNNAHLLIKSFIIEILSENESNIDVNILSSSQYIAANKELEANSIISSHFYSLLSFVSFQSIYTGDVYKHYKSEKIKGMFGFGEQDPYKIKVGIAVTLSFASFLEIYSNHVKTEANKLEKSLIKESVQEKIIELRTKIYSLYREYELMHELKESKKIRLESALALYGKGGTEFEKVSQAREDYYNAQEKLYKKSEELVENIFKYFEISGKIRIMFLNVYENKE